MISVKGHLEMILTQMMQINSPPKWYFLFGMVASVAD